MVLHSGDAVLRFDPDDEEASSCDAIFTLDHADSDGPWYPIYLYIYGPGGWVLTLDEQTGQRGNNSIPCWQAMKDADLPKGVYTYIAYAWFEMTHDWGCNDYDKATTPALSITNIAKVDLDRDTLTLTLDVGYQVANGSADEGEIRIYDNNLAQVGDAVAIDDDPQTGHVPATGTKQIELTLEPEQFGTFTAVFSAQQTAAAGAANRDEQPKALRQGLGSIFVMYLDLDVEDRDETTEDTVGGLVVRNFDNNQAPRRKITLRKAYPIAWTGNLFLTRSNSKVRVFDAAQGGGETTFNNQDNKFTNGVLPKDLWVEGAVASDLTRDVTLEFSPEGIAGCSDTVKFTVLWVTLEPGDHTTALEEDNGARGNYSSVVVTAPLPCYTLGAHLFCSDGTVFEERSWLGRGSEFVGVVSPGDFVPAEFNGGLRMTRWRVSGNTYWGPNGNENQQGRGAGDDTGSIGARDDDPQSGGSGGRTYDLDFPGLNAFFGSPQNTIVRDRINFEERALWNAQRCSTTLEWYTRQSIKKTGGSASGTASGGTLRTLTDTTKNWGENEWAPGAVYISDGTGMGQYRTIDSNTATVLTVVSDWRIVPDATSVYQVVTETTWTPVNDCDHDDIHDNESRDGITPVSWNLE